MQAPHPVPTATGRSVQLPGGRAVEHVEHDDRPFGDATRVLGEFSMDDPDFDLATFMQNALKHYDSVQYSVVPDAGESAAEAIAQANRDIARGMLRNRDYDNFKMMQRTRAVFDTTHHSITLELLSRSGSSVKEAVASSFPSTTGSFDEWRERFQIKNETSVKWWLENKKVVMIKTDHLPTVSEQAKCAAELQEYLNADESTIHDLPDNLMGYPRPVCQEPPAQGEEAVLGLQCDLERPVAIEDKQLYRVKVLGLAGTDGQAQTSDVFSGKQLRGAMDRTFKQRKQYLNHLQRQLDKMPTGVDIDTDHCAQLVCGASMNFTPELLNEDTVTPGKVMLGMFHTAWSSSDVKSRKLMITGLLTGHVFSRPPRPEVEVEADVCATCLEDIAGEAWRCGTCNKTQHHDCFDGWRRMCASKNCAVTCPNCRAEVPA